jgi:hypothetical protein
MMNNLIDDDFLRDFNFVSASKGGEDKGYFKLEDVKRLRIRRNKANYSMMLDGKIHTKLQYQHEFNDWCRQHMTEEERAPMFEDGDEVPIVTNEDAGKKLAEEVLEKKKEPLMDTLATEAKQKLEEDPLEDAAEGLKYADPVRVQEEAPEHLIEDIPEAVTHDFTKEPTALEALQEAGIIPDLTGNTTEEVKEAMINVIEKRSTQAGLELDMDSPFADRIEAMRWSYSRLTAFETCKHAWKKTYLDKEKGRDNAWGQMGNFAHNLLEYMFKGQIAVERLGDNFVAHFDKYVTEQFPQFAIDLRAHYKQKIGKYLSTFKMAGQVMSIEEKFEYKLPSGRVFVGIIDLVVNKYGQLIVVDHKVSKVYESEDLMKKKKQILMYAPAVKLIYKTDAKAGFFHFVQDGTKLKVSMDEQSIDETLAWADNLIDEIKREKHFPTVIEEALDANAPLETEDDLFFCSNLCNHRDNCEMFQAIVKRSKELNHAQ